MSRPLRRERTTGAARRCSGNAVSCLISSEPQRFDIVHERYKYETYLEKFTRIVVPWRRLPHSEEHGRLRTTQGLGHPCPTAHDTTYRLVCNVGGYTVGKVLCKTEVGGICQNEQNASTCLRYGKASPHRRHGNSR